MNSGRTTRALHLLAELSRSADTDQFGTTVLVEGCSLLLADRGSIVEISAAGTNGHGWPGQPGPALRTVWDRRHNEHPAVQALRRSPACYRLREHLSLGELGRMPIYCDFMRPMGCRDELAIALEADRGRLVALAMARVDAEFTDCRRTLKNDSEDVGAAPLGGLTRKLTDALAVLSWGSVDRSGGVAARAGRTFVTL